MKIKKTTGKNTGRETFVAYCIFRYLKGIKFRGSILSRFCHKKSKIIYYAELDKNQENLDFDSIFQF